MNKKLKFKGSMKQFMRWPLYLTILLIWLDILIFMVSVKAGILATLGIVVYIVAALLLTRFHRPLILNDLIAFANQYESLEKRLLDDLALPYAIMDTNGRMIWSNKVFAELTGKEQLYNKHITTIFPEITPDKLPVPEKQEITEMSTNFGDRIYRVSMQLVTMKDVVNEARILENVDADINLVAMFFYDETELQEDIQMNEDDKLVVALAYLDNYEEALEALKRVFGIAYICPVVIKEDQGYEQLEKDVVAYMDHVYPDKNKSFKMHVRRAKKTYPGTSMELNADLGGAILDAFPEMKVDVHNPQLLITVEIREKIYIYSESIPGPGGMPIGTNGKAMLLLSGGIDSPVAGYMIAKRGVKIDAVYFHAPPYTSERAKQKVVDLAKLVARYSGPINLYVVNFTDIQLYIYDQCPHDELTIIMRRYMMKIAERIGKEQGCLGLITGESIGQVASQTVQSLAATNEVCTMPVFRPVIGFDKQEIVDISLKINTYETSIQPYEDCCTIFVAKHPVTKPNIQMIKKSEKKLEEKIDEMMDQAVNTAERIYIEA